jgi:hypothetical protein
MQLGKARGEPFPHGKIPDFRRPSEKYRGASLPPFGDAQKDAPNNYTNHSYDIYISLLMSLIALPTPLN